MNITSKWLVEENIAYIFLAYCAVIFICGIFGNILIISIYKTREKNSSKAFIVGLAFIDLFSCIVFIPLHIVHVFGLMSYTVEYIFVDILVFGFILIGIFFVSTAFDRYFALAKPLLFLLNYKRAIYVIIIDVVISIIITALFEIFTIFLLDYYALFRYFVIGSSLAIVAVLYSLAFLALKRREKMKINVPNELNNKQLKSKQEAVRMAKVLIVLTILFTLAYVPYMLYDALPERYSFLLVRLYHLNNILNFPVYYISSDRFRKEAGKILVSLKVSVFKGQFI